MDRLCSNCFRHEAVGSDMYCPRCFDTLDEWAGRWVRLLLRRCRFLVQTATNECNIAMEEQDVRRAVRNITRAHTASSEAWAIADYCREVMLQLMDIQPVQSVLLPGTVPELEDEIMHAVERAEEVVAFVRDAVAEIASRLRSPR